MNKHLAASVLGRLKNISKELNLPYNLVMQLFAQERLLYRLSLTEYKDNFLLKGGLLLYSMTEFKGRSTKDMVSLALLNSRMKDFYDIYTLMKKKNYNGDILKQAVQQGIFNYHWNSHSQNWSKT
jgi:hypothetical protein